MNAIVLDLEFTRMDSLYKKEREICKEEIIQIGAVKVDKNNEVVDRFSTYVRPMYCDHIASHVVEMTHITDEMVKDAPTFTEAMDAFTDWIGDEESVIYSWSDTDKFQMKRECELKNCSSEKLTNMFEQWIDLQFMVGQLIGIEQALSLENALRGMQIEAKGQMHSALSDAENTAAILQLTKDEKRFREQAKPVAEMFEEKEPLTYSMAGLFANIKIA